MTFTLSDFQLKFSVTQLTLFRSSIWTISVRPEQLTLGSLIISPTVEAFTFNQLNELPSSDSLLCTLSYCELALKSVFGAELLNIYCLMLQDPIIHFHVFPRYSSSIFRYEEEWIDTSWPGPLKVSSINPSSQNTLFSIHEELSSFFSSL